MKKFLDAIRKCPLFVILVVTAVLVSAAGWAGVAMGIYKLDVSARHPMIQTVLTNELKDSSTASGSNDVAAEADAPQKSDADTENAGGGDEKADSSDSTQKETTTEKTAENTEKQKSESTEAQIDISSGGSEAVLSRPTQYKQIETRKSRDASYRDLTQIALETDYPYVKVDKSYFDDALFIGDSRVEGLALYSGLDNATFAYMEGLTTFGLMSERIASNGTQTLTELLGSNTYKKIYIMLGINEAGYNTDAFAQTYKEAIASIQELQPGAVIFIMGCMHVSSSYSDAHSVINNDNIDDKNGAIAAYADGIKVFYLDVNTVLDDETGGLIKDYTWDDIHLQAQYYSLWENYLYERGLRDDAFSN